MLRKAHQALPDECALPRIYFQEIVVFQDDNGPAHRARHVMDFLENGNMQHMDWPAMSPDLNPISNLLSESSCGLNKMDNPSTNVAELIQAVVTAGDIFRIRSS